MKKVYLIVVLVVVALLGVLIYLKIASHTTSTTKPIQAMVGINFDVVIEKPKNSLDYTWQPEFDENLLGLVVRDVIPAEGKLFGAPAREIFTFQPIKSGETKIVFVARGTDEEVRKTFWVVIK